MDLISTVSPRVGVAINQKHPKPLRGNAAVNMIIRLCVEDVFFFFLRRTRKKDKRKLERF